MGRVPVFGPLLPVGFGSMAGSDGMMDGWVEGGLISFSTFKLFPPPFQPLLLSSNSASTKERRIYLRRETKASEVISSLDLYSYSSPYLSSYKFRKREEELRGLKASF